MRFFPRGMAEMIWLNGALEPVGEARISPFDHGITVGDGVFETLISYAGIPFAFTRHHQRLDRSAAAMGLEVANIAEQQAAQAKQREKEEA